MLSKTRPVPHVFGVSPYNPDHFILNPSQLYLCGHSLGPSTKRSAAYVAQALSDWQTLGVGGWNQSAWIGLPQTLGQKIAPLIGAYPDEVVVTDSTSVNLFKVLVGALALNPKRKTILADRHEFPADLYIAQGIAGAHLRCVQSDRLAESLDGSVAVLLLSHVNYRSAKVQDMALLTKRAHEQGVLVVWDLSHSVGILPIDLDTCDADFAVGCTYKYLNGGPGAPSFVYANRRLHKRLRAPIFGWMGHAEPFAFRTEYHAANGVAKLLGGTPAILSMKALEGALEIYEGVDLNAVQEACAANSGALIDALAQHRSELVCASPLDPSQRGGHVAFEHKHAYEISRALIERKLLCDYREPNLIRLCVNPFYLTVADMQRCAETIDTVLIQKTYLRSSYQKRVRVT